jgi:hypothetical protein
MTGVLEQVALIIITIAASVYLYRVYRAHRTERRTVEALDGGIEKRLAKRVAEIAKSTGVDPGDLAQSLANNINAERARLRAAGYYDSLYKKVWRRLRGG